MWCICSREPIPSRRRFPDGLAVQTFVEAHLTMTVASLRVSTGGQTVESQRLAILDYAHHHGLTVQTFVEAHLTMPEKAA